MLANCKPVIKSTKLALICYKVALMKDKLFNKRVSEQVEIRKREREFED